MVEIAIQVDHVDNLVKTNNDTKVSEIQKKLLIMIIVISILLLKGLITLAIETDINGFVQKTDFADKLKKLNKKATLNKTKDVETEKKLTDLTKLNQLLLFLNRQCFIQPMIE